MQGKKQKKFDWALMNRQVWLYPYRTLMSADPTSADRDEQFVLLMTRHQAALSAFVRSLVPDRGLAEEVLQASTVVLWQKRSDFSMGSNFRAWAFKVARYQALAHAKSKQRNRLLCFEDGVLEKLSNTAVPVLEQTDERIQALEMCLDKLPVEDRELVEDCYFEDLSMQEQADQVGRTIGALRQVLYRIRTALRRCVESALNGAGDGDGGNLTGEEVGGTA